jgi:cold shock CspA family protein
VNPGCEGGHINNLLEERHSMANVEVVPLQVSFRDIAHSPAIEARVRKHAAKLSRFHQRITACRVVIAAPEREHHKERLYVVRVSIALPGGNIHINRSPRLDLAHADVYVAIRDAFAAAVRRIEDFARRLEGRVKRHEVEPHGIVRRLDPGKGFGFIETATGDEVYFNRKSVLKDAFKRLKPGSKVRFVLAPQVRGASQEASTVRIVGKHNPVEAR